MAARLVLVARDVTKAQAALAAAGIDQSRSDVWTLDLADLSSMRAFTDRVLDELDRVDLLVANAGVMATPWGGRRTGSRPSSAPTTSVTSWWSTGSCRCSPRPPRHGSSC